MGYNSLFCTKEQSDRLKQLGIDQQCANFYWSGYLDNPDKSIHQPHYISGLHKINYTGIELPSAAFTSAELGAMLPDIILVDTVNLKLRQERNYSGFWNVMYVQVDADGKIKHISIYLESKNEAEARAATMISLLKNKLVDLEIINKQLNKFYNQ